MDEQLRAAALGELAMQAGIERASFLTDAARQFEAFMDENGDRIRELGGLVLIDDEPEYLAVAADGTFRSRTRYQDDEGEWVSETEVIESAAELVETTTLPTSTPPSRRPPASRPAWSGAHGGGGPPGGAGVASEMGVEQEPQPEPAEGWAGHPSAPADKDDAARMLYDLALTFQERSQRRRHACSRTSRTPPRAWPASSATAWSSRTTTSASGSAPAAPSRRRSCRRWMARRRRLAGAHQRGGDGPVLRPDRPLRRPR